MRYFHWFKVCRGLATLLFVQVLSMPSHPPTAQVAAVHTMQPKALDHLMASNEMPIPFETFPKSWQGTEHVRRTNLSTLEPCLKISL